MAQVTVTNEGAFDATVRRQINANFTELYASSGFFHQATLTLTNDQIKALPTTRVTFLASPGASLVLFPTFATWKFNWFADYGNIDPLCAVGIVWGNFSISSLSQFNEDASFQVSNLLANGDSHFATLAPLAPIRIAGPTTANTSGLGKYQESAPVGNSLSIYAANQLAGAFTLGNAANTMVVTCVYLIYNPATGLFQ